MDWDRDRVPGELPILSRVVWLVFERGAPMPFTFGIASHQLLFRALLRDHLVGQCEGRVVGEFSNQEELARQAPSLRGADLLLLDCDLPGRDVLASAHEVVKKRLVRKVALLVAVPGAYLAQRAIQLGLHGVLHKQDSLESIQGGLTTILSGGLVISPNVCLAERTSFACVLTAREIAVLIQLASGNLPAKIARELKLAPATVVTHRRNAMKKLGLRSQLQLVLFAVRSGMISLEQTFPREVSPIRESRAITVS